MLPELSTTGRPKFSCESSTPVSKRVYAPINVPCSCLPLPFVPIVSPSDILTTSESPLILAKSLAI